MAEHNGLTELLYVARIIHISCTALVSFIHYEVEIGILSISHVILNVFWFLKTFILGQTFFPLNLLQPSRNYLSVKERYLSGGFFLLKTIYYFFP